MGHTENGGQKTEGGRQKTEDSEMGRRGDTENGNNGQSKSKALSAVSKEEKSSKEAAVGGAP